MAEIDREMRNVVDSIKAEYETALAGYWNLPYHWTKPPATRDPFTEHGFLLLLEQSGSVGPASSGWVPMPRGCPRST